MCDNASLTDFEAAVLERIAEANPRYRDHVLELIRCARVATREWSGAGGFVTFAPNSAQFEPSNLELDAQAEIQLPSLRYGLGALLFVRDGKADWLELFTYDEEWQGDASGFRIVPAHVTKTGRS